jgi:hypothetical protein
MKTKFIKGTNKKYSIREDGSIISHKKSGDKLLNPCRQSVSLSVNGVKINAFVPFLVKKHFNYFICKKCNKKSKGSTLNVTLCKNCKVSVKESNSRYNKKLSPAQKEKKKKYKAHARKTLKTFYINDKLKAYNNSLPKEVIELKRQQLKLHRELKKQEKYDTNK